jgi:hypothetical protein
MRRSVSRPLKSRREGFWSDRLPGKRRSYACGSLARVLARPRAFEAYIVLSRSKSGWDRCRVAVLVGHKDKRGFTRRPKPQLRMLRAAVRKSAIEDCARRPAFVLSTSVHGRTIRRRLAEE